MKLFEYGKTLKLFIAEDGDPDHGEISITIDCPRCGGESEALTPQEAASLGRALLDAAGPAGQDCPECHGYGELEELDANDDPTGIKSTCPRCNGSGGKPGHWFEPMQGDQL